MKYYKLDIKDIYKELNSNKDGLTNREAREREAVYGKNVISKEEKDGIIKTFFKQFLDPIVYIMLVALVLSIVGGEYIDAVAIFFIIVIDAIVGTIQEYKAGKEAESLANLIKVRCKVLRDGKERIIDSDDLTVGDIMLLESGNKVSADARIIDSFNLLIDESILTGESLPREKNNLLINTDKSIQDIDNMLFAGTNVIKGRCKAIVTDIGNNTEIGKISTKVREAKEEKTPLAKRMDKLTKQITVLIISVALFITILMLIKGTPLNELFTSVVALSVSALPEGLPLALTLALTIGSHRMSKRNVIVKKLNAVESLGSCTIIASDKTGTLTVNEQTAKKIVLPDGKSYYIEGSGYNGDGRVCPSDDANIVDAIEIAKLGVINNESTLKKEDGQWKSFGDSIDIAFRALGEKLNLDSYYTEIKMIPYESEKKYSAVYYNENNNNYCTVKGSTEKVLSFCDTMIIDNKKVKIDKEKINLQNEELAKDGYRVIAIAKSSPLDEIPRKNNIEDEDLPKMSFIGLVAFIDPIREETIDSIKKCKEAGIKVVMITGDHPLTAFAIARNLNIAKDYDEVSTGEELNEALNKGQVEFDKYVKSKKIFTRVTPIEKLEIINSYKRMGEFIAVTGDGVNDAPAIKSASIGVAMGSGTDVAKEASNMIITDDNFLSIVNGIEEGRNAYSNIRKVVYLLISCGISEVLFFTLSLLFNLPLPLVAIQLLWLNLVTDGLQDISLSFEREEKEIMREKPINPKESIFNKLMLSEIIISGVSIGLIVFFLWLFLNNNGVSLAKSRGFVMTLMVFIQNIHVLNCRSEKMSLFEIRNNRNRFVLFSILFSIGLQLLVLYFEPLSSLLKIESIDTIEIIYMLLLSLPILVIMEIFKSFVRRKERK